MLEEILSYSRDTLEELNQYQLNVSNQGRRDDDDDDEEENLTTSILNEIKQGIYVCLVCTEEVDDESEVWSCGFCHRVYDLDCIKDWATKDSQRDKGNKWRCPSCNGKSDEIPSTYTCWCGKVMNPQKNIFAPHSCGQTCSEPLLTCPHTCPLSCHPGPHSKICQALPKLKCDCGAETKQFPCVIAPYENNWKCDRICNELMPCGVHKHNEICHSGLCGECQELVEATCYCSKHQNNIPCYLQTPFECSDESGRTWTGSYQCDSSFCGAVLDCQNEEHVCQLDHCHPHTINEKSKFYHRCNLNPKVMKNCPCGKCKIKDLLGGEERESCSDPIPTCDNICGKTLDCGHKCYWKCHFGNEHAKCFEVVDLNCRCGFCKFSVPCAFAKSGNIPQCTRKCQALKNCRRHRCGNICCDHEKIAIKRERDRKKNNFRKSEDTLAQNSNNNNDNHDTGIEAVHICLEPCNKLLSCKQHRCQWQDHPGKCPPCLESSSDDLICACGRTVLIDAPVRCGASPTRKCQFQCLRPSSCGHEMPHPCHEDDIDCPKCTKLVTKKCACGKRDVQGVYCYTDRISCGTKCDRLLPCQHECPKICCLKTDDHLTIKCTSACNKVRKSCGHMDTTKCHWPKPCNENMPCKKPVKLYCECKRRSKVVECQATSNQPSRVTSGLECDTECLRIKRNQQLFAALKLGSENINTTHTAFKGSSGLHAADVLINPYSEYIISVYTKQKKWCIQVENVFRDFVGKWLENKETAKKSHNFPAMRKPQRTFIHHLSDVYGLYSQSQDPEPHRSVHVAITSSSAIPPVMLSEALSSTEVLRAKLDFEQELQEIGAGEFNAIIINDCRFGITVNELEDAIMPIYKQLVTPKSNPTTMMAGVDGDETTSNKINNTPTIKWYSDSTYLFLPADHETFTKRQELQLAKVAQRFKILAQSKGIAFDARLCKVDFNGQTILKYGNADSKSNGSAAAVTVTSNASTINASDNIGNGLVDNSAALKVSESSEDGRAEVVSKINYDDKSLVGWF